MSNLFKTRFKKSFGKRLIFSFVAVFALVFASTAWYAACSLEKQTLTRLKSSLTVEAQLLTHIITPALIFSGNQSEIQGLAQKIGREAQARFTVIDSAGRVLGDTDETWEALQKMDNHRERPEFKTALEGRIGSIIRYSKTLKTQMFYVAVPLKAEERVIGAIRVSLPFDLVHETLVSFRKPIIAGSAVGILFVVVFGVLMERSVSKRVRKLTESAERYARGDLTQKILIETDDELKLLAKAMNRMAASLKEQEKEIEEEKAEASAILENMTDGVVAVSANRNILFVNPKAEEIFQLKQSDVRGKALAEVLRHAKIGGLIDRAVREQRMATDEVELSGPPAKVLRVHAIGIQKANGSVLGVLFFNDVTDMRKLENMRRDFVANVSHELKTPLTSIAGFIETLLESSMQDPEQNKHFLKMMEEDANRLKRLIEDVLDLAAIESRETPLELKPMNLGELKSMFDKVISGFENQLKEKNIHLRNNIVSDKQKCLLVDSDKLNQVIVNLLDNAIKFNKKDGSIVIKTEKAPKGIRISVEDGGIGIPEKDIPRIFERFFRVDKARSREMGGTGLGLSIVKHIVEVHGGTVSCESNLGTGSTFSFTLPVQP